MNLTAFKNALVALYNADSAVQVVTGRSTFGPGRPPAARVTPTSRSGSRPG
jgi:hypothetical protein